MRLGITLVTTLCLLLAAAAFGQTRLEVGDEAPGLDIEEWVKGEETSIQPEKVYIIEFWATWCRPCHVTIPTLTDLQEEYGDDGLVIISISSEEVDVVRPWVRSQGSKMDYTVAVDRRSSTSNAWLRAAGLTGIPAAFIVDRAGKIAFMGNPHPKADGPKMWEILTKVLSGRYDPKLEREAEPRLKAARGARKTKTWRMAFRHYDEVIDLDPKVFAEVALERFEMMLVDMEDRQEAYKYAREKLMGEYFTEDPGALAMLVEKIATDPKIDNEDRDLDLALQAAQAAMNIAARNEPRAYATVALARYHRGEFEEAIRLQKQAYFIARPKDKAEFKRVLEAYQEAVERVDRVEN